MIGDTYWAVSFKDMLATIEVAEILVVKDGKDLNRVEIYIGESLGEDAIYVRECAQDEEGAFEVVELECAENTAYGFADDAKDILDYESWRYSETDTLRQMRHRDRTYGVKIPEPVEEAV